MKKEIIKTSIIVIVIFAAIVFFSILLSKPNIFGPGDNNQNQQPKEDVFKIIVDELSLECNTANAQFNQICKDYMGYIVDAKIKQRAAADDYLNCSLLPSLQEKKECYLKYLKHVDITKENRDTACENVKNIPQDTKFDDGRLKGAQLRELKDLKYSSSTEDVKPIFAKALEESDYSYCSCIPDRTSVQECTDFMAKNMDILYLKVNLDPLNPDNINSCIKIGELLGTNYDLYEKCVRRVAFLTANLTICDTFFNNSNTQMYCSVDIMNYAGVNLAPNCTYSSNKVYQQKCEEEQIARAKSVFGDNDPDMTKRHNVSKLVAENNLAVCDALLDPSDPRHTRSDKNIAKCYLGVADLNNDINICNMILSAKEFGQCYGIMAMKRNDVSLCDPIVIPTAKYQCLVSAKGGDPDLGMREVMLHLR
jgi:hypothetical protein